MPGCCCCYYSYDSDNDHNNNDNWYMRTVTDGKSRKNLYLHTSDCVAVSEHIRQRLQQGFRSTQCHGTFLALCSKQVAIRFGY